MIENMARATGLEPAASGVRDRPFLSFEINDRRTLPKARTHLNRKESVPQCQAWRSPGLTVKNALESGEIWRAKCDRD